MLALFPRPCRTEAAKPHTAVPVDIEPHPVQVRFIGLKTIVENTDSLTELFAQADGAKSSCAGFKSDLHLYKNRKKQPVDTEHISGGTSAQRMPHRPVYLAESAG